MLDGILNRSKDGKSWLLLEFEPINSDRRTIQPFFNIARFAVHQSSKMSWLTKNNRIVKLPNGQIMVCRGEPGIFWFSYDFPTEAVRKSTRLQRLPSSLIIFHLSRQHCHCLTNHFRNNLIATLTVDELHVSAHPWNKTVFELASMEEFDFLLRGATWASQSAATLTQVKRTALSYTTGRGSIYYTTGYWA